MFSLFLDQSCGEGVFALFHDECVVESVHREVRDSRHPCAVFQDLLERHALSLNDIHYLSCGIGPGSYTGIRSAASSIKGISFARQLPIVALSSLLLYAPEESGSFLIASDGGMAGVYTQEITIEHDSFFISSPQGVEMEELLKLAYSGKKIVVGSSDWLTKKGVDTSKAQLLVYRQISPHLETLAKIAFQEFRRGNCYTASSLPVAYLRKTQAEIERQTKMASETA